jgi:hypothetical protein
VQGWCNLAETYNVFISWSGPRSKSAAEALKEWLPLVVPTANPWMSATDIDKGTRWREEVATALDTMKAGIICLTPENLSAEWLLFEAGAISKARDPKTRVWTYLLGGLRPQHLKEPLAMFQATTAEKVDTPKLVDSINKNLDPTVPESRVTNLFDKLWPDLEKDFAAIPAPSGVTPATRPPEEMLAEILELTRASAQNQATVLKHLNVSELLHEREITYRSLLAAYLKIQELQKENAGLRVGSTPTRMNCRCVSPSHGHPIPCPQGGTEIDGYCKVCHDIAAFEIQQTQDTGPQEPSQRS